MKILIVEDDWLQSENLISEISLRLPNSKITLLESELAFRQQIFSPEFEIPDIILLDIMLRWTNPSPNMSMPPSDIKEEGFYNAGFRCQKLLSNDERLKHIPIILYSVLTKLDLENQLRSIPAGVTHFLKDNDIVSLINLIKKILQIQTTNTE